ncbi:MAG: hypothetical protein A2511_05015 [Deltaproteobacteria bacterium RIFOXYD12_FULL_50_9]|nr:MAG: hypothetical protein A2511_05015 [Deltaproteobacteria bacterium RIFOXYD12_FULL_50_9]
MLGGAEIFSKVTEDTQLKHLMFSLSGQEFGVNIKKIKEIISLMEITTVPNMPEHVCGVVNLRGKVVPIIDLKSKLGIKRVEGTVRDCILVVESKHQNVSTTFGFIADQVNRILTIDSQDIDTDCRTGIMNTSDCIAGIARVDRGTRILIDIDYAFNMLDYAKIIEQI